MNSASLHVADKASPVVGDDHLSPEVRRILESAAFASLMTRRRRLSLILTLAICVIYYGFILAIAFFPRVLAIPVDGVMSLGIPLGLGVIVSAIVLTGLYVSRANSEFDGLTAEALRSAHS